MDPRIQIRIHCQKGSKMTKEPYKGKSKMYGDNLFYANNEK
jgi:hypothetical protein